MTKENIKHIKPYDSFGYHNFDKVMSWHPDNDISPFRVARCSNIEKCYLICETCGYEWHTSISSISKGTWCPQCKISKAEKIILDYLKKNNIRFIYEKSFNSLKGARRGVLSYDFYLPEYNLLIEYQGEQHNTYKPGMHKNYEEFMVQLQNDKIKREYASKNNIQLLEIWYWEFDNIEEILNTKITKGVSIL